MTTQYDQAVGDAERAYHAWTAGQRREASFDFGQYQAAGGRSSWPVWLARYRYDYEFPDAPQEARTITDVNLCTFGPVLDSPWAVTRETGTQKQAIESPPNSRV